MIIALLIIDFFLPIRVVCLAWVWCAFVLDSRKSRRNLGNAGFLQKMLVSWWARGASEKGSPPEFANKVNTQQKRIR